MSTCIVSPFQVICGVITI